MLLMYSMYFVVVMLLFQLLAKHSLPRKHIIATPHHTQTVSFTTINLFSPFNTMAKTNHIDSTRPAPLSMNKLANSLLNIAILIGLGIHLKIFRNSKYQNSRNKTEALVLLKKRSK